MKHLTWIENPAKRVESRTYIKIIPIQVSFINKKKANIWVESGRKVQLQILEGVYNCIYNMVRMY